jgi:hypothetical protein
MGKSASKPSAKPTKRQIWEFAQYPLLALIALVAAASTTFGQALVFVYAVIVVARRRTSTTTFGLALIILVAIPIFQALGQATIAENAAIYVYELLVVGTIQAILELRQNAPGSIE